MTAKEKQKKIEEIKVLASSLGIKNKHIADRININTCTLSTILSGKIKYVSDSLINDLNNYLKSCKT